MKHEILLLPEVAKMLRLSIVTVNRLLAKRRQGIGDFPLPITEFHQRGRWLAADVDAYIERMAKVNAPNTPVKRNNTRERQAAAEAALARHGIVCPAAGQ